MRWRRCTFGTYRVESGNREAYEMVRQVASGERWCALLSGGPGAGKTHLAIAALHEKDGYFWKVPDLMQWLRGGYDREAQGRTEQAVSEYQRSPALLVLDDLGVENRTDWAMEQTYRILDGRYEFEAPTIITTNVASEMLDERIRSRYRVGQVYLEVPDRRRRDGRGP